MNNNNTCNCSCFTHEIIDNIFHNSGEYTVNSPITFGLLEHIINYATQKTRAIKPRPQLTSTEFNPDARAMSISDIVNTVVQNMTTAYVTWQQTHSSAV